MFEDNRKICIDLLIEDGQTSYVVLEFEDDIEDAMEDNEYEIIYKTDSAGNALKWCMNQFGDDDGFIWILKSHDLSHLFLLLINLL